MDLRGRRIDLLGSIMGTNLRTLEILPELKQSRAHGCKDVMHPYMLYPAPPKVPKASGLAWKDNLIFQSVLRPRREPVPAH
jgi:hypothetical protein